MWDFFDYFASNRVISTCSEYSTCVRIYPTIVPLTSCILHLSHLLHIVFHCKPLCLWLSLYFWLNCQFNITCVLSCCFFWLLNTVAVEGITSCECKILQNKMQSKVIFYVLQNQKKTLKMLSSTNCVRENCAQSFPILLQNRNGPPCTAHPAMESV